MLGRGKGAVVLAETLYRALLNKEENIDSKEMPLRNIISFIEPQIGCSRVLL